MLDRALLVERDFPTRIDADDEGFLAGRDGRADNPVGPRIVVEDDVFAGGRVGETADYIGSVVLEAENIAMRPSAIRAIVGCREQAREVVMRISSQRPVVNLERRNRRAGGGDECR